MTHEQVCEWAATWRREAAGAAHRGISRRLAGPGARPTRATEAAQLGRFMFRSRHTLRGVENAEGHWTEEPREVDAVLWESREGLWASSPPSPAAGDPLLRSYFFDREATFPHQPRPRWARLAGIVLAGADSAPGRDNAPGKPNAPGRSSGRGKPNDP